MEICFDWRQCIYSFSKFIVAHLILFCSERIINKLDSTANHLSSEGIKLGKASYLLQNKFLGLIL